VLSIKEMQRRIGVLSLPPADDFKRSSDQGLDQGRYEYGICLMDGNAVSDHPGCAAHYFTLSAPPGFAGGQCEYEGCQGHGIGVKVSVTCSADQGFAPRR
jgi:TPR repeat protein